MKYKHQTILFLILISLISSIILSVQPMTDVCGQDESCQIVQNSDYSSLLGIKLNYYGVIIFSVLLILTFSHIIKPHKHKEKIIKISIIVGSVIAIFLLYVQQFQLKAHCKFCIVIDISLIICLILILKNENNTTRSRSDN